MKSSIGRAIIQIAVCAAGGPIACVAISAGLTLAAGGTIQQALIAGAIAFAQIGSSSVIHGIIGNIGNAFLAGAVKIAAHAVVAGALSVAQGGNFETGAITGAVSAGAGLLSDGGSLGHAMDGDPAGLVARTAVAAVAGGTASVLSGGKFANGAITGAFAQLYNGEGCAISDCSRNLENAPSLETAKSAAWALTPGSDLYDCASTQCSGFGWAAAAAGVLPGAGKFASKSIWTVGRAGSAVENAFQHWLKHGPDFSELQNAKQYVERAKDFLLNPQSGVLTKIRPNGDVLRFDPASNTFGAMTSNGTHARALAGTRRDPHNCR